MNTSRLAVTPFSLPFLLLTALRLSAATPSGPSGISATNATTPSPLQLTSTLTREIKITDDGAAASYGLAKVFFKSDLTQEKPITIVTPDGRTLYARPAFLVLENRSNGQLQILGTVTNVVGEVVLPDSVVWTNVLGSGPNISLEYRYLPKGAGLEQNVVLLESPTLPAGWTNSDVSLEFWTEWIDSTPTASETSSITLRPESGTLPAIQADDQQLSFGPASKLVAGGRAFSLGGDDQSLPVAKTWAEVQGTNGSPTRTFTIEVLDMSAASSQLQALPTTSRHASLSRPQSSRSGLLQAALSPNNSRFNGSKFNSSRFLIANTSSTPPPDSHSPTYSLTHSRLPRNQPLASPQSRAAALVLDWTLLNAIPLPANAVGWWPRFSA